MMDSLASLNIIPFLGLMNILEVKYLHMPEVYRTMLAILCDYNPLLQNNIIRTRRYLKVLLAREPDLAQCLLNFMDEPQENADNCSYADGPTVGSDEGKCSHAHCPCSLPLHSSETNQLEHTHHDEAVLNNAFGPLQQGSPSYNIDDDLKNCLISIQPLTTAAKSDFPAMNIFHSNIARGMNSSAAASGNQYLPGMSKSQSCGDGVPHFVPVINIHHKGVLQSDLSAASISAGYQPQDMPLFLSHLLSSSPLSPAAAQNGFDKSVVQMSAMANPRAVTCEQKYTATAGRLLLKTEATGTVTSSTCPGHSTTKSSKKYRVAQTQTSTEDPTRKLHKATATEEALPFLKKRSNVSLTTSRSQVPPPPQPTASQPNTLPPGSGGGCLSKLLGQPSVAYLPAGHFIDNRNCIVGESKSASATMEKQSFYAAGLSGKVSSAAAKLRLLSTQAGEDCGAAGPVHSGFRQAATTVTAKLGSLSVKTSLEHFEEVKKTTTFRFSSKSGDSNKTVALSKILPVPRSDTNIAASSIQQNSQTEEQSTLSDKQVQVGQRQIAKRSKMLTEEREEPSQFFSSSQVAQEKPMNQKDGPTLSVSHQALEKKNSCMIEGNQNLDVTEEVKKTLSANRKLGSKWRTSQQERKKSAAAHIKAADKALPQSSKLVISKSGTSKQKVQVVEVSLGGTHSLSSFPYIQQMVLPDGQVSTITHNSSQGPKPADHATQPLAPLPESRRAESRPTKTFTQGKSQNHLAPYYGQASLEKPKTQTVLSRNQVKLSISIQNSSAKLCASSGRKQSLTSGQPNSPDHAETLKSPGAKRRLLTNLDNKEEEFEDSGVTVYEDDSAPAESLTHSGMPSTVVNRGRGKRKRSCSCPKNTSNRTNKKINLCDNKYMPALN